MKLRKSQARALKDLDATLGQLGQQRHQIDQQASEFMAEKAEIIREVEQDCGLDPGALGTTHVIDMDNDAVIERPRPTDVNDLASGAGRPSGETEATENVTGIEIQQDGGYKIGKGARWTAPNGKVIKGPRTLSAEQVAAAMIRSGDEAAG